MLSCSLSSAVDADKVVSHLRLDISRLERLLERAQLGSSDARQQMADAYAEMIERRKELLEDLARIGDFDIAV